MRKKKPLLVMTLLVRDEEDIVERNICFHLNKGVDFIVAADNNSVDSTPKILRKYQKRKVLHYEKIKDNTYEQSKWVSGLAKIAVERYKATHLIHCDADEFWYPEKGNLKDNLPTNNVFFSVPVLNYLPEEVCLGNYFLHKHLIVNHPYDIYAQRNVSESYRYLLYKPQPKVITTNKYTSVAQGNHFVISKKVTKKVSSSVLIHHFPIRSFKQFKNKVVNGGSSYLNNPDKISDIGWHWRDWYQLYKKGLLKLVYRQLCINNEERRLLIIKGILKRMYIPKKIVFAKEMYYLRNSKKRNFMTKYLE